MAALTAQKHKIEFGGNTLATIITVSNQKSGVGKTTTSATLATGLCLASRKVLGADLDPQGNLGFCLGLEAANHHTALDALKGLAPVREVICQTDYCDILASDITLSSEAEQAAAEHRERILKNTLAPVTEKYDYVIIDTPPALNLLAVNAYTVSNYLTIPIASDILSLAGLAQLKETIEPVRGGLNPYLHVSGILLARYNKRTLLSWEVLNVARQLAQQTNTAVSESKVGNGVAIVEAPAHGESIFDYNPRLVVVKDYMAFIDEIVEIIHLKEA